MDKQEGKLGNVSISSEIVDNDDNNDGPKPDRQSDPEALVARDDRGLMFCFFSLC
jgi:hypothetical protein